MDPRLCLIARLCLISSCWSLPVQVFYHLEKETTRQSTEPETPDVFEIISKENEGSSQLVHEGDIIVPPGRSAMICPDNSCFWPKSSDGTVYVPYTLSSNYTASDLAVFSDAMQEFATVTCIRFVPQTTETNYLNILPLDGCLSHLGRTGGGQEVFLSYGCILRGSIQHELNHALGFFHEHSRSDRDDHVTIVTANIAPNQVNNFNKENTNNLGLEYDFASVMHYGQFAFSNASRKATIIPKPDPNTPIGQRTGLSNLDVSKINTLYQCDVCAFMLSNSTGFFQSTNYPSMYPPNTNCTYLIRMPADKVVLLFDAFDVQSSKDCSSDYIKVYDGSTRTSPVLLNKACGTGQLLPLTSTGSSLLLEFITDSSVTGSGFKISYSNTNCGGTYTSSSGTIASPYYPNKYRDNMNCAYFILAPVGYKVSLKFTIFVVELQATCSYDSLSILDGTKTISPLLGKYCGSNLPPPVTSTGNFLQLQFLSDNSWNMQGFLATYNFVSA